MVVGSEQGWWLWGQSKSSGWHEGSSQQHPVGTSAGGTDLALWEAAGMSIPIYGTHRNLP